MQLPENIVIDETTLEFLKELFIVVGIGFLLGLERQFSKDAEKESSFAGVRTFPLVALLGYLSLYLGQEVSPLIFGVTMAGTILMIALSYFFTAKEGHKGGTSEFALLICFILGGLVLVDQYHLAVAMAVLVTAILALKVRIHTAVRKLDLNDIFSILLFVVITALVLPLLPDQDYGPYGIFNLYKIWLIVSIFVTLNFLAYFLDKYLGQKNSVLITGILGGFASSTATSWYFSRHSGKSEKGGIIEAAAIILASSIMFPRLLIWLLLLNVTLFKMLWLPIIVLGIAGLLAGIWISRKHKMLPEGDRPKASNPINLKEAFFFAGIYIAIQFLVAYADEQFGEKGVLIASGISGLTDIDAITISMANYHPSGSVSTVAAIAILIAAFANTAVKYIFCMLFGNANLKKFTSYVFIPLFLTGFLYILYLTFF
jgi:uncharacterized membrane protein (DUF4010 family)